MECNLETWEKGLVRYVRSGEPDLSNRQMALILTLGLDSGPHTVRGLAAKLNVSKPVITRALNSLSALGYVRRVRDQDDRRSVFVTLTERGTTFIETFSAFITPEAVN